MDQSRSIEWWNNSLDEVGIQIMDKVIATDASTESFLQTGKNDLARAMAITGMTCGQDRTAVEVGCGLGRISVALAEHFGRVVGLDIAPRLIEEARRLVDNDRVTFEVSDGNHVHPQSIEKCDTVFSYEVMHYINPESLTVYFRDVYDLLAPEGQFVFQLNMEQIHLKTKLSFWLRQCLYACGIKQWRGWPNGPGLRRYYHSYHWLRTTLTKIGFEIKTIAGPSVRQTWIVAEKN